MLDMAETIVLEKIHFTRFGAVLYFSENLPKFRTKKYPVKSAYNLGLVQDELDNFSVFDECEIDFNAAEILFSDTFLTRRSERVKWYPQPKRIKNKTYVDSLEVFENDIRFGVV